ncbi:MAG TPA: hypothetical protein VJS63_12760 [Bradyrhizobium sp.]|nr:hypothetical protein [Bradyrhizobium sp.]
MSRFALYVAMAFVTAFVGVSWAARGFPMRFSSPVQTEPLQQRLTTTFGDKAEEYERKAWESKHTAQSDKDPILDKIRLDALQAANAYTMSPCDKTMKQNLVAALTAYTRAWQAKLGCPRQTSMLMFCSDKKLNEAAKTFSTPLDRQVKEAFRQAFEQKGVVAADFPAAVRFDMLAFSGPGLWPNEESPICLPRQRASASPAP